MILIYSSVNFYWYPFPKSDLVGLGLGLGFWFCFCFCFYFYKLQKIFLSRQVWGTYTRLYFFILNYGYMRLCSSPMMWVSQVCPRTTNYYIESLPSTHSGVRLVGSKSWSATYELCYFGEVSHLSVSVFIYI